MNNEITMIVDGSMVPSTSSGVACLIGENISKYIEDLNNKYKNWEDEKIRIKACNIYKILGKKEITLYIKGIGKENTSTEIEKIALKYGEEIIEKKKIERERIIIYSDCLPNIESLEEKEGRIKWIKSHMNLPPQEVVDLAAKLANLLKEEEEIIYKGKIYDLMYKIIQELKTRNKSIPEVENKEEKKEEEDKKFKEENIFFLKEENNLGKFRIYYDETIVYEVLSPSLKEVFLLCALKKETKAKTIKIHNSFYENKRVLMEGDYIEDCRVPNTWIFFKKDKISGLTIPIYTFKGPKEREEDRIDLRDIKKGEYCLYALPSIQTRDSTTISSTVIIPTKQLREDDKKRIICVGSLINCLNVYNKRNTYMEKRIQIKRIQKEINTYKSILKKGIQIEEKFIKINGIPIKEKEIINILKRNNKTNIKKEIEELIENKIKKLEKIRNSILGESVLILKDTCKFFL